MDYYDCCYDDRKGKRGKRGISGQNGTNGIDGNSPYINEEDGHWWVGEKDTGISAQANFGGALAVLTTANGATISGRDNIKFNFTQFPSSNPNISYDKSTGLFTITKTGTYTVNWELGIDSVINSNTLNFAIMVENESGDLSHGVSFMPVTKGEITGTGLVYITEIPSTVRLQYYFGIGSAILVRDLVQGRMVISGIY